MQRARDPAMEAAQPLAQSVRRSRCPEPHLDPAWLLTHSKQARYSTDYASICGTNIMRGTAIVLVFGGSLTMSVRRVEKKNPGGCTPTIVCGSCGSGVCLACVEGHCCNTGPGNCYNCYDITCGGAQSCGNCLPA